MTKNANLSARVNDDVLEKMDLIAEAADRSRTWVLTRALSLYFEGEGGDVLREAQGLAELNRGESVDFDDAMEQLESMIDAIEARRVAE